MEHLYIVLHRYYRISFRGLMILGLSILNSSCFPNESGENLDQEVTGLKPVYMDAEVAKKIEFHTPTALKNPGKIYTYGNTLFINELHSGIYVINNTDPANPIPLSFIKIYGNVDIAVKSGILYADNAGDLVAFNISDINNIQFVNRVEDVFPTNNFPSQTGVYFECADPSKGMVVGWEETVLPNITCRR